MGWEKWKPKPKPEKVVSVIPTVDTPEQAESTRDAELREAKLRAESEWLKSNVTKGKKNTHKTSLTDKVHAQTAQQMGPASTLVTGWPQNRTMAVQNQLRREREKVPRFVESGFESGLQPSQNSTRLTNPVQIPAPTFIRCHPSAHHSTVELVQPVGDVALNSELISPPSNTMYPNVAGIVSPCSQPSRRWTQPSIKRSRPMSSTGEMSQQEAATSYVSHQLEASNQYMVSALQEQPNKLRKTESKVVSGMLGGQLGYDGLSQCKASLEANAQLAADLKHSMTLQANSLLDDPLQLISLQPTPTTAVTFISEDPGSVKTTLSHCYRQSKAHHALGRAQTYTCIYCGQVKTSASLCSDNRVRIRCACGGQRRDGQLRMHANWRSNSS